MLIPLYTPYHTPPPVLNASADMSFVKTVFLIFWLLSNISDSSINILVKESNKVGIENNPSSESNGIYLGPPEAVKDQGVDPPDERVSPDEREAPNVLQLPNEEDQLKRNAERLAAMRSLKTNLYFILICLLPAAIMLTLPMTKSNRIFLTILFYSVNKACMTIVTAVANFGTIRQVGSTFWKAFLQRFSDR